MTVAVAPELLRLTVLVPVSPLIVSFVPKIPISLPLFPTRFTVSLSPSRAVIEPAGGEIVLRNGAVSTSGDTEQFREIEGVRYSHIIDPKTGLGLRSAIAVTVVARRGLDADPIATAVSVMGEERGRVVFERRVKKLIGAGPK